MKSLFFRWLMQSVMKRDASGAAGTRGRVVLVYARDCPHVMKLAAALRTLLARATDDHVRSIILKYEKCLYIFA